MDSAASATTRSQRRAVGWPASLAPSTCRMSTSRTMRHSAATAPPGSAANAANGGGIFNLNGSTMTLTNCSISGHLGHLADKAGTASQGGIPAGNGANGEGGGIFNNGTLTMSGSKVSGNLAVGGAGGETSAARAATAGTGTAAECWPLRIPTTRVPARSASTSALSQATRRSVATVARRDQRAEDGQGLGGGIAILDGASVTIQKTKVRRNLPRRPTTTSTLDHRAP